MSFRFCFVRIFLLRLLFFTLRTFPPPHASSCSFCFAMFGGGRGAHGWLEGGWQIDGKEERRCKPK